MIIRKVLSIIFIVTLLKATIGTAAACIAADPVLYKKVGDLIDDSSSIVLATVVQAEIIGNIKVFYFKPERSLKGNAGGSFELRIPNIRSTLTRAAADHGNIHFWTHAMGSQAIGMNCAMEANFSLGHRYLIFNAAQASLRSYEEIGSNADKWLRFVTEYLTKSQLTPILRVSDFIRQFDTIQYYQCSTYEQMRQVKRPILLLSIHGEPPILAPYPKFKTGQCMGTGQKYLYLKKQNLSPLFIPVRNEQADLKEIIGDIPLLRSNILDIKTLARIENRK